MNIKGLVLPPDINVIVFILGLLLLKRYTKFAKSLIVLSLASLFVLSLPPVTRLLLLSIETIPPISEYPDKQSSAMIVVLGGGVYNNAPEYDSAHISGSALERLHYAVKLHRKTGLPLLVSGGNPKSNQPSGAEIMQIALNEHYAIQDVYIEIQSRTTYENALYSMPILKINDIDTIILVTTALHMKRAIKVFANHDIKIISAPTIYYSAMYKDSHPWYDIMPNVGSLSLSRRVLHEWLGMLWYSVRGYNK